MKVKYIFSKRETALCKYIKTQVKTFGKFFRENMDQIFTHRI